MTDAPLVLWFRRDLRLADHPMLTAAAATGRPLVPVAILDPETEAMGTAPLWRWGLGLGALDAALRARGLRLTLRRGPAPEVLRQLVAETGAAGVHWSRLCDPASRERDGAVKAGLRAEGLAAESHPGHLLHEPWTVETGQGGFYRVFTPYCRAVRDRSVPAPLPVPPMLRPPAEWPASDRQGDWLLDRAMRRGASVVRPHLAVGEDAALVRLRAFLSGPVADYATGRNLCATAGTSRLSENLAWGEISPRTVWHAAMEEHRAGAPGAETYLKEIVWREFAWHLLYHTPHIAIANWRPEWDAFPWRADTPDAETWRRGMTGEPFVDAGMRELYVTGTMHNRARMIVASYLTKHLLTHWQVGLRWFQDCLVDWDPASNAMGWQWAAGSGPDATPYFRIFNPSTQAERFDPAGDYRRRWVAELSADPPDTARAFFDAVPRSWALDPAAPYPARMIDLAAGRERALAAYGARNS
ncbi:MAG TPA: deoxyribodipyrimidine photo-lyase [Paracoccaceae bacterium]|nr:deoxyribodipyrimidine photo-lyase [Paracoccaceae bacterium]